MDQVTFYLDVPVIGKDSETPFITTSTPKAFKFVLNCMADNDEILPQLETLVLIGYRGTRQTGWALLKKVGHEFEVPIDDNLLAANALAVPYVVKPLTLCDMTAQNESDM